MRFLHLVCPQGENSLVVRLTVVGFALDGCGKVFNFHL